jgi:hypothetical protein
MKYFPGDHRLPIYADTRKAGLSAITERKSKNNSAARR